MLLLLRRTITFFSIASATDKRGILAQLRPMANA
ncbi:hypothetical protein NHJ6243_001208 [Beauveria neobassiana]